MPGSVTLTPHGPYSLRLAAGFGFGPTEGRAAAATARMGLAFCRDDLAGYAGAVLRQEHDDAPVTAELHGDGEPGAVAAQLARILSLDHDAMPFVTDVARRDPILGAAIGRHPGLRPVLFHSPYEAAAWAVIAHRRPARQAAVVRTRLGEQLGATFDLDGEAAAAFPAPAALQAVAVQPGLPQVKVERLRAVADAALDGRLDPARLRALPADEAMADLQRLPGIGPFSAALVLVRSTGVTDVLAADEPRLRAVVEERYGLDEPLDAARFTTLAEPWRPFRTWACVTLRYDAAHPR